MTELILIRHGETAWNREYRMQGHTDTKLSETGLAQAAALARRLSERRFSALYSSDLSRARQTAQAIADATGHAIRVDRELRERVFGIFEGLTFDEIAQRYPEHLARFRARDPDYAVPGGESPRAFFERSIAALTRIAEAHPDESVVVVTHGLVLDTAWRAARGTPLEVRREAPILNASLNVFRRESGAWFEVTWGDIGHLDEIGVVRYPGSAR